MARNTIEAGDRLTGKAQNYTVERVGGSITITLESGEKATLVPSEIVDIVKEKSV